MSRYTRVVFRSWEGKKRKCFSQGCTSKNRFVLNCIHLVKYTRRAAHTGKWPVNIARNHLYLTHKFKIISQITQYLSLLTTKSKCFSPEVFLAVSTRQYWDTISQPANCCHRPEVRWCKMTAISISLTPSTAMLKVNKIQLCLLKNWIS